MPNDLIDIRPPGIAFWYRPGDPFTLLFEFPADYLDGMSFTAKFG